MAVLPIRLFPDPVLRKPSQIIHQCHSPYVQKSLQDLIDTLRSQPYGIGIAAPQVGFGIRLIIVDVSSRDPRKKLTRMINPLVASFGKPVISREGCMSLPDYTANVLRYPQVEVEWFDEKGQRRKKMTKGIEAICLQHEVDHLNGILFIDRASSLKTDVFPRLRK